MLMAEGASSSKARFGVEALGFRGQALRCGEY